jgi:diguanylate cyclase (GGDEF)-like protein/PAS domain S-box-containing protein
MILKKILEQMRRLIPGSLRLQLILSVALVHAVLMSLFVWDMTQRQHSMLLESRTEQALALARSVATSSAGWVASRDFNGLQEIITAQARYPELLFGMVLNNEGRVLAHSDASRLGLYIEDLPKQLESLVLTRNSVLVDVISPVILSNNLVGWVRLGLGQKTTAARLAIITRDGFIYGFIAILLGSILAWLMGTRLTRRLKQIERTAHAIENGASEQRASLEGRGEIAHVAQAFNTMLDSILSSYKALDDTNRRMAVATDSAQIGIWEYDPKTDSTYWDDWTYRIYGVSEKNPTEPLQTWEALIHPADLDAARLDYQSNVGEYNAEFRIIRPDGKVRWIKSHATSIKDAHGSQLKMIGLNQDITEIRQVKEDLQRSHALYHQAETMGNMGHYQWDIAKKKLISCSVQFARIHGMTVPEALDYFTNIDAVIDLIHPDDKARFRQTTSLGNELQKNRIECRVVISGSTHHLYVHSEITYDHDGVALYSFGTVQDITERKQAEVKLERLAHYDGLTNLPNRVLLTDRLNQAMVQSQRHNRSLAVAYLDLDGFKTVNDTYGHPVGDELLIAVSRRMKKVLRAGDTLARIGGDEFVAVMVDWENMAGREPVLERLLKAAAEPVEVGDVVVQVSVSIGVTVYPQDDIDADRLMRHADQSMYVAKQAGRNRYHLFDTAQDNERRIKQKGIAHVRAALERSEFVLYYQPKVNMKTGEVVGVEALIRWQHSEHGLIPPLDFLPVIDGHAISLELGEWVIDTALTQIIQWQNMGINLPISVNISAYQLQQRNFASRLAVLLSPHPEVNRHYLELEILETSVLNDVDQVSATMTACDDLGVRFSLDDFGTGYSSLTHLRRLPAYLIKIDQSFVCDMLKDADDLVIVYSVIGLAKAFQREVIAEGVETVEHGLALLQLGCELAQGFGIAYPMPAGDIPAWVSSWRPDDSWLAESLRKPH